MNNRNVMLKNSQESNLYIFRQKPNGTHLFFRGTTTTAATLRPQQRSLFKFYFRGPKQIELCLCKIRNLSRSIDVESK